MPSAPGARNHYGPREPYEEKLARVMQLSTWLAGLEALPAPAALAPCLVALGFERMPTEEDLKAKYRDLARRHHPDAGGSEASFRSLKANYEDALLIVTSAASA